jgi:hypothetical protein
MSYIMVDIESDGPVPGDYSMVLIGAVLVKEPLDQTFFGRLKPISEKYLEDALKVTKLTRKETLQFEDPKETMTLFKHWILDHSEGRPIFISDNNGFDWQFVNWYFHHFLGENPFGYSSQNLGSLYKGLVKDVHQNFKHLRITKHTHHPVDDAKGNAEALITLNQKMGLKICLE